MQSLGLIGILAILMTNVWGVALATGFILRNRWLALVAGPLLWTTLLFAVETHFGLGKVLWLGLVTTVSSVGLIRLSISNGQDGLFGEKGKATLEMWRPLFRPRALLDCGAVFLVVFGYAFAWRFAYPDLDGSSEKIPDLAYICSYLTGDKIPVADVWLYPYRSVQYYSFQYYGAALMGRMFGLSPGATFHFALTLLIALTGTAFGGAIWETARKSWVRILLLTSMMVGGSGATTLVHFTHKQPQLWSSMRFIGNPGFDLDPVGPWFNRLAAGFETLDLPGEHFSYLIFLGDYHPPLSGFYLLGLGVLAAILWQRENRRRYAALLGATLTWSVLSNTWTLPLQGLAILAWAAFHFRHWRFLLPALASGALIVWLAAWVYLANFTAASAEYKTAIRLVPANLHTPPIHFAVFLLPTIGLSLLAIYSRCIEGVLLGFMWLGYLALSELFYVDDIYSGVAERFNTTLKWWPWIVSGVVLTLGPILLERAKRRWVRVMAIILCAYPCVYGIDLGLALWNGPKPSMGKLDGTGLLAKETAPRLMLNRLKLEPPGLVIERPTKDSFTNSAWLPVMAGHRMYLGWLGHEQLWRGYPDDLVQRQDRLTQFFSAEMPDAAAWLSSQGIDYVLWYQNDDTPEKWGKINRAIGGQYLWCEILAQPDGRRVGFWKSPKLNEAR